VRTLHELNSLQSSPNTTTRRIGNSSFSGHT